MAAWSQHQSPSLFSSASTMADTQSLNVPSPRKMSSTQSLTQSLAISLEDQDFSTNPDPRSRTISPVSGSSGYATPSPHPDLDSEVATLSSKLVHALNHQTTLDDTLSSTRQELEVARERIRELEEEVAAKEKSVEGEKKARVEVEKDKKKIEQELENLTTALFEEANNMVISAKEESRKEQDAIQRKNDQLKQQLADTESILKSQQEQLAELKVVMEQMTAERDDRSGTTPSSPGFSKFDPRDDDGHTCDSASQEGTPEPFSPTYPTNLTHLLQPVVRTDLTSYDDFLALLRTSKRAQSRVNSGTYSGLLNLGSNGSQHLAGPSNASSITVATLSTPAANTAPQSPHTPASANSTGSSSAPLPPLKETKFFKRVLVEDVEPTLRLDLAPAISWLNRRSVLNAMTEGTLVVEPVPTNSVFARISKPQFYPCSLCGETRKDEQYLRDHRFRTSESESAVRYYLCRYCLTRVRSTCDFLGFLRIVKDGHWRADDVESERAAWEESVRLREQMFWSRIGGGVVPAMHAQSSFVDRSRRASQEVRRPSLETEREVKVEVEQPDAPGAPPEKMVEVSEPVSTDGTIEATKASETGETTEQPQASDTIEKTEKAKEPLSDEQTSTQPMETPRRIEDGVQPLSITIP